MSGVLIVNQSTAVAYAASELSRCLGVMKKKAGMHGGSTKGMNNTISLGLFEDFGLKPEFNLEDPELDDAYAIDVEAGNGIIAGSNPRSVLLGVYRFLRELGCRWVRPGKTGERIPAVDIGSIAVKLQDRASYRHRAVCIEGAVSLENVLDFIDWMPKAGYSGFYMQFREGYTFFNRWYSHGDNLRRRRESIDLDTAREYTRIIEKELERRGFVYHAVGHGWHIEIFGMAGKGWDQESGPFPKELLEHAAIVDGERIVPWNIPMLTALCYSDSEVQERLSESVANYAQEHPNVDYLHFWLDDFMNNKCECENCSKVRPYDLYIQILNKIDQKLAARGLSTRIVFLAYSDLLWMPVKEWFDKSDRFIFMYANARSDYSKALKPVKDVKIPEFVLNRVRQPNNADEVAAVLQQWMEKIEFDSFIYEYYSGVDTISTARTVSEDIRNLSAFKLNGLMSCQALRVFFPNGFGMELMGRVLWDKNLTFDEIAEDYFNAAYGADGMKCFEFTEEAQSKIKAVRKAIREKSPEAASLVKDFSGLIDRFEETVRKNIVNDDECIAESWKHMQRYTKILRMAAGLYEVRADETPSALWQLRQHRLDTFVYGLEEELQPVMQPSNILGNLKV